MALGKEDNTAALDDQAILDEALERFGLAEDNERINREAALRDLYYVYVDNWDAEDRKNRERPGQNKPCLQFNKLLPQIKKVSNQARLNFPSIKVSPEDDNADIDTAQKLSGLVKQVLKNANADVEISAAFENTTESSIGWFRVITKWCDDESFDQELDIKKIPNPFSVYRDVNSVENTSADSEWGFITDEMSRKEFDRVYPDAVASSFDISSLGDTDRRWITEDTIRVAEYYRLEKVPDLLIEGVGPEGEIVKGLKSELDNFDNIVIARKRPTFRRKWMWYKITGTEILEREELPNRLFPLVSIIGRQKDIGNEQRMFSLIRFAIDAQKMYNYWRSCEAEQLASIQKAPYIGAKGQFKSDRGWKDANVTNKPFLEYDMVIGSNGQVAPPPQRAPAPEAPIGFISAAQSSNQDIKETIGLDNPMENTTTGANVETRANVLSGKALETLNMNGEMATYDFIDNLNKAVRQCFRIIIDVIPEIYDTERVERILGEDDEDELVLFNGPTEDGKLYDLTLGKYDIDIDVGPDYATKRKETAEQMMEFMQKAPGFAEITGDLVAKTQDWKDADKFAERIKKTIPPEILGDDDVDEEQLQQQLAQVQQEKQQLEQQLDQALELIQTKQIDKEMVQMKEQGAINREIIKAETALEKQEIDTEGEIKEQTIQAQASVIEALISNQENFEGELKRLKETVKTGNSQTP